jgi:hypothetical protein
MPDDKKTYQYITSCSNCHSSRMFDIPLGTTVDDFMREQVCIHCGCHIVSDKYRLTKPDTWCTKGDHNASQQ